MSADNGVYIARFPTCYRVCYGSAIENIEHYPEGSEERKSELKDYFGKSPLFRAESQALEAAREMSKGYEQLEYGISILGGIWDEFDPEVLAKDLAEVEPEYNHEWFSLRNIKPTEMQLWAGDKRLVNIQGKWSDELESFIRMANLGIKAHQEEIKRRIESMLEYDPKDVAFPRHDEEPENLPIEELSDAQKDFEGDTITSLVLEPRNPELNRGRGNNATITPIDELAYIPEPVKPPLFQRTESVQETEQT